MIEQIIGATIANEFTSLPWAEQVGYLVTPYNRRVETEVGVWKDKIIPVAPYIKTEECAMIDKKLYILEPDKQWDGLVLISTVGDNNMSIADNVAKRQGLNIDQDIQISVWLNDHQGTTPLVKGQVMAMFMRKIYKNISVPWVNFDAVDPDYIIKINKLKVNILREIKGNPFGEYAFSSDQALFQHKYSAFGMVIKMQGLVFPYCFPDVPELEHTC